MTDDEKLLIKTWILRNVSSSEVPGDEGFGDGLCYNLIHLLYDGPTYRPFVYAADQNAEIDSWSDATTSAT